MKQASNWFEIYCEDFARAKKFYETVLNADLEIIPTHADRHEEMDYAKFPLNGALIRLNEVKPGPGGTVIYFETENIDPELSRAEKAGGQIITPKTNIGENLYIALIEDTEGNIFGLRSAK